MSSSEEDDDASLDSQNRQIAGLVADWYAKTYCIKTPCRTSILRGSAWVQELMRGNPTRIYESLRMSVFVFTKLQRELSSSLLLKPSRHMDVEEKLAIFLFTLSQSAKNRDAQERFQRSGETISRKVLNSAKHLNTDIQYYRVVNQVTEAIVSLASKYIRLPGPETPQEIQSNSKFYPFFKDCRMALDGTHIPAFVPAHLAKPYRNRKGFLSQNVLAACSFDMRFTYVLAGWEGSAADSTVLSDAYTKGLTVPEGKYDLADAGYGLSRRILTPYRGVRYHLKEWKQGRQRYSEVAMCHNLNERDLQASKLQRTV